MEIFGFVMLLLIASYVTVLGVATCVTTIGFTGKFPIFGLVILLIGLVLFYVALSHSPFTISITH